MIENEAISQGIQNYELGCRHLKVDLVPKKGLEPPHPCEYVDLNHARLPIPPLRHMRNAQAGCAEQAAILSLANAVHSVNFRRRQMARQPGVFTPFFSMATALAIRFCRVSSFFASSIHRTYSLRFV